MTGLSQRYTITIIQGEHETIMKWPQTNKLTRKSVQLKLWMQSQITTVILRNSLHKRHYMSITKTSYVGKHEDAIYIYITNTS